MLAKVYSCAVVGLEGGPVEVEVDISQGLPISASPPKTVLLNVPIDKEKR